MSDGITDAHLAPDRKPLPECPTCGFFGCHGGHDCKATEAAMARTFQQAMKVKSCDCDKRIGECCPQCHGVQEAPPARMRTQDLLLRTPDTKTRACFGKEQGLHLDGEKPRIADMIPADLILEAGRIFAQNNQPRPGYPEGKYPDIDGKANYKQGIRLTRLMDSMMRHLLALMNGEDSDPDSGFDHAGHLLCNLSMFWYIRANCEGMDDR